MSPPPPYRDITGGDGATITGGTLNLGGGAFDYGRSYNLLGGSASGLTITGFDTGNWQANLNRLGTLSFTAVPEPSTYGLIGAAALAGCALGRRRRVR